MLNETVEQLKQANKEEEMAYQRPNNTKKNKNNKLDTKKISHTTSQFH